MRNAIATGLSLLAIVVTLPVILPLGIIVRVHDWAIRPLVLLARRGL